MASSRSRQTPIRSGRYKRLSTISIGGHEMRFIGVNTQNNEAYFPLAANDCPGRLLFVGSDVLSNTSISKKNYIRHHVRFAKVNLATKMRLTGFKIEGINNGEVVWFYSIQGLFHVAFEMGDLAFQKDCLTKLQDVWLKHTSDARLPREGAIRYNMGLDDKAGPEPSHSVPNLHVAAGPGQFLSERTNQDILDESRQPVGCLATDEVMDYIEMEMNSDAIGKSQSSQAVKEDNTIPAKAVKAENVEQVSTESDSEDNKQSCICPKHNEVVNQDCGSEDWLQSKILTYFKAHHSEEVAMKCTKYVLLTIEFLKQIVTVVNNLEDIVTFQLMEEYLTIINSGKQFPENSDCFGVGGEKFAMLYLASAWLGKQFHQFETEISQRVNNFKKQNITCIDSLPCSEKLIDVLFPSCMKIFVTNWLGFVNYSYVPMIVTDHSYSASSVLLSSRKSQVNFPLVQLILEFCSNCLISGIAHVVFTRLHTQNEMEIKGSE